MAFSKAVQVVVPTRNSARTLELCLSSLKDMDYPAFSIAVIDRFSTDKTREISERLRVTVVEKELNRSEAYNFALRHFSAEYFALVDSDCVVPKNWLGACMRAIQEHGVGAVGGFYKTPKDATFWNRLVGKELDTRRRMFKRYISRLPSGCLLIKRECLGKVKFDGALESAQETDWGYRLAASGYKMIYLPQADVLHYHRNSVWKFFKQQFEYGYRTPDFYVKNKSAVKGDQITSFWMNVQPVVLGLSLFLLLFGVWYPLLGLSIYWAGLSLKNRCPAMWVLYCVRCFAWTLGLISWVIGRAKKWARRVM